MKEKAYIYQIKNLVNNKVYIGSTNNVASRWRKHKSKLNNNYHENVYLQNSWNKFGESKFEFSVLDETDLSNQFILEQNYLNDRKPFAPDGYNIVRTTYKGAESPHLINKECKYCGQEFRTFSNLALLCDDCKKYRESFWNTYKNVLTPEEQEAEGIASMEVFNTMVSDGYLGVEDFWESVI